MTFSKEEIDSYIAVCKEGDNYSYNEDGYSHDGPISSIYLASALYALQFNGIEATHFIFNTELIYELRLGIGIPFKKGGDSYALIPFHFTDHIPYDMGIAICLVPGSRRAIGPSAVCVFNAGNLDPQKAKLMLTFE